MKHSSLVVLILLAGLYWASCDRTDDVSCAEKGYDIRTSTYNEYDSLFPYTKDWTTLKFSYSNDSLDGEVMEFKLYQIDTFYEKDRDNNVCVIEGEEILRLYYEASLPVAKKMRISHIRFGEYFQCEVVDSAVELYTEYSRFRPGYSMAATQLTLYRQEYNFQPSYIVQGKTYFDVLIQRGSKELCPEDSTRMVYSSRHGFIELYNECSNELYQLIHE